MQINMIENNWDKVVGQDEVKTEAIQFYNICSLVKFIIES